MEKLNRNVYALLLAGGSGERLWPLSRRSKPKQFLEITDHRSLLEDTIDRISPIIPIENRWVITTQQHADEVAVHVRSDVGLISVEPYSRNTGPAILLNSFAVRDIDPTAIIVVIPTDHYIPSKKTFIEFLSHAIDCAQQQERIVLLGARPTYPATGYGYIEYKKKDSFPYDVIKFHEKPHESVAKKYVSNESMLWNIGISCAQVGVMIKEFEINASPLYDSVQNYWLHHQPYDAAPSESIDYAVMEKSNNLCVLPVNFVWCDVGNLNTFLSLCEHQKKDAPHIISVDSHNNVVNTDQNVVAFIGIENICVVQTEDVLLIAKRDETEKVKQVLEKLKRDHFDEYL